MGGSVRSRFYNLGASGSTVTYRWVISDTGIGMSEEFLKHIYEPFAQEHSDARSIQKGTGLGMAIVKGLIDQMNGSIEVMMPQMDGLTASRTIRGAERPDAKTIPIIAMTANTFDEDAKICQEAGMNAHLSKPLPMEKVVKTIVRCCKKE